MDTLKKNKINVNKQLGSNRLSIFLVSLLLQIITFYIMVRVIKYE